MKTAIKNFLALVSVMIVVVATSWAVHRFHKPGQLDVIAAQAMDMSQMHPPSGAAPVALTAARLGSLNNTVTYTGTVLAYNEQEISPRVTGRLVALPVYPGDTVQAGQTVAQLDTAELAAKTSEAAGQARAADLTAEVANLTHALHHNAALEQAAAQVRVAEEAVASAKADEQAASNSVSEAEAGVTSAKANAEYLQAQALREKRLYDLGYVSRQVYENELAQSRSGEAAVLQAQAKVREAKAMARSAGAKVAEAENQIAAAKAGKRMAVADLAVAAGQARQAAASATAMRAGQTEAQIVQGYTRIQSPANGLIIERLAAPGTLVQPGTVILRLAEIDRVRLQANVAVSDLAGIRIGAPVSASVVGGNAGQAVTARVTAVFPSADTRSHTAIVEAVVPNPGHRLMPGSFVTMRLTKDTPKLTLIVPAEAILAEGGQSYLWVARGADKTTGIAPMPGGTGVPPVSDQYKATGCGMLYSAADAKKLNYICPMDKSKIVPVTSAAPEPAETGPLMAHRMDVTSGASDGTLTEITADDIRPGTRIVTHGQTGLSEGVQLVSTAWTPEGPKEMPRAAEIAGGGMRYRCEVCGLTFSAEDAKKYGYRDPMEGGKLVPITP